MLVAFPIESGGIKVFDTELRPNCAPNCALGTAAGPNGSTIYHVDHHWVTQTGETLLFNDAYLTAVPTSTGKILADYVDGVTITGGTGRYANASGKITAWGAIDLTKGQLVLRFEGRVCFGR